MVTSAEMPLRFITATSIFDGHDSSINIVRRILLDQGAEVIHLGHNRSVDEIVRAALQEDVDAIAISSYQGGHVEFFRYLIDRLNDADAAHIRVFGGGGGTITADEIAELETYGVEKIYTPADGHRMGLEGMGQDILARTRRAVVARDPEQHIAVDDHFAIGQWLTLIEQGAKSWPRQCPSCNVPVVGLTGTGGAGKSSVIDELLFRLLSRFPQRHIAILALDPTRHKSGGALLGDRIRLNSLSSPHLYMRSMATRQRDRATSAAMVDCIDFLKTIGFDLVLVETAGIGQAEIGITEHVDLSVYVMTNEYGAPSQLEKIQMLDFADIVVLNKADKRGAQDALRDVRRQWRRDHKAFDMEEGDVPVLATVANHWQDPGITRLQQLLCDKLSTLKGQTERWQCITETDTGAAPHDSALVPPNRSHYLAEISANGMAARAHIIQQVQAAANAHAIYQSLQILNDPALPGALTPYDPTDIDNKSDTTRQALRQKYNTALAELSEESRRLLHDWADTKAKVTADEFSYTVRDRTITGSNYVTSLSHLAIPKIAVPPYEHWGELLRFLLKENLPGAYPYTAGVFPYRTEQEDPTRMFAAYSGRSRTPIPNEAEHRFRSKSNTHSGGS